ncbi:MAG TPA: alpha/beta hydrolase [Chloroflexota bacterium]|nr:alpha/beta hydrolase [Chloroflexota bacterium]
MQTSVGPSQAFPRYDPAAQYEVSTEDVEYRREGGEAWLARVYRPRGAGPFPALLDVHGGAWSMGDRLNDAPMDAALAASGMVVVAVDFRLAPQHPYPASLADVNYATRWLKAHAADFGADPRHLGGLGSSSGGHQIMLSAMRPRDPRYAAIPLSEAPDADASLAYVLACWPILDPYARYLFAQETGRKELVTRTEGYFLTVDAMQEGNPQCILDRHEAATLPPVVLFQGTADTNLTVEMSERFVASYRAAGGQAELELFPDMPHGFGNQPGPEAERAIALMKAFVARQLATAAAA